MLVWALLPRWALTGYLVTLYICEVFNFALSLLRLRKVIKKPGFSHDKHTVWCQTSIIHPITPLIIIQAFPKLPKPAKKLSFSYTFMLLQIINQQASLQAVCTLPTLILILLKAKDFIHLFHILFFCDHFAVFDRAITSGITHHICIIFFCKCIIIF